MRLLVYTTLFPNPVTPHHGVFVATRLRHWRARHGGEAHVVAPVPWSPPVGPARWAAYRKVPTRSRLDDLEVRHPRYLSPPGFGDGWRAPLLARGSGPCVARLADETLPDVLDAHYAWPDGVAAVRLRDRIAHRTGRRLPVVITCRGTDLNLAPELPAVRPQLAQALQAADHVICVAEALRRVALELGVPAERVTTLRNGVDLQRFQPGDKAAARVRLGLDPDRRLVLAVGHLVERKGPALVLDAFARTFPDEASGCDLALVGQGELAESLAVQAQALGVAARVHRPGAVHPDVLAAIADWYRAADVLVLASSREGWPNVVLEGLACGTPVIATRVWGTPEILGECPAGRLVDRTVDDLADGLARLDELDPAAARPWAERHDWTDTADGMQTLFERIAS